MSNDNGLAIAIIGMSGRFPGAKNLPAFWDNLAKGVESIGPIDSTLFETPSFDPNAGDKPNYVKMAAPIADVEQFDAAFFDMPPSECELLDPQHRLFLECAWEAFEDAGYNTATYQQSIGVYASVSTSTYLLNNLMLNGAVLSNLGPLSVLLANDKDYMATRTSYKLNLRGPSIMVQTACSSSLVGIHLACQALLNGECQMALVGGSRINVPQHSGYYYQEMGIFSPDGHCRAFDANGQGTIFGNGVGAVVLKRLDDALEMNDHIYAVIRGSAVNNDGAAKVGFTAPGLEGQSQVIAEALALAGVPAESITYVETHGTATALGDPIEVAALTQAFRAETMKNQFCALGSVKTNIGHLEPAAGIAGLIKTVLALVHQQIPPSLHFERPNPNIDFGSSPFYVNTRLQEWRTNTNAMPRRAGVSSFGIGGTNAHIILEEAPADKPSKRSSGWQVLPLSAKTPSALDTASANLGMHLTTHPDQNLSDVAFTLQVGRRAFKHRRILVAQSAQEASNQVVSGTAFDIPRVIMMFPGQSAQYINMGRDLYDEEPYFREQVDRCAERLIALIGVDIRAILYPDEATPESANTLSQTIYAQAALFSVSYSLARLWQSWGVQPDAMIGHSVGEYVAACLADVLSFDDALTLIAARGQLMQSLPNGAMLAVPLTVAQVQEIIAAPKYQHQLSLAAINAESLCVIAGSIALIAELEQELSGITCRRLQTSHAFHSAMVEPILPDFKAKLAQVRLKAPHIPYISNLTGTWITSAQATSIDYWADHLRNTVCFSAGIQTLFTLSEPIFLEVGPGTTLSSLVRAQNNSQVQVVIPSMRHAQGAQPDRAALLQAFGVLWVAGVPVQWESLHDESRRRVSLPTYPFERQRYWIDPPTMSQQGTTRHLDHHYEMTTVSPALNTYWATRNATELKLREIWRSLLGLDPASVDDDFFALGGHSLLAVMLLSRIKDTFQVQLNMPLSSSVTIARLASQLEMQIEPSSAIDPVLVPFQTQGTRTPFFCVHPISGFANTLQNLTGHLGPYYGLQNANLALDDEAMTTIEALAARYLQAIRTVQLQGPYRLGGYSFGGVVAFEMAHQLQQLGESVENLVLLDCNLPNLSSTVDWQIPTTTHLLAAFAYDLARQHGTVLPYHDMVAMSEQEFLQCLIDTGLLPDGATLNDLDYLLRLFHSNVRLLSRYRIHPYEGKTTLFYADQDLASEFLELFPSNLQALVNTRSLDGWETLVSPPITAYSIPGNHYSILDESNAVVLGRALNNLTL